MKINTVLITLNILSLIATLIWLMVDKGWEPLAASIALIAALIAQIKGGDGTGKIKMTQNGGKGSTNYQSGRDIHIN